MSQPAPERDASHVLTLEEISKLASEGSKPAETLMNVVALIATRFQTDVCSAYLLEPDRANLVLAATVGLRPQCIGTLRLGLHEGLTGLVAEQVAPVAVPSGTFVFFSCANCRELLLSSISTEISSPKNPWDMSWFTAASAWLVVV